ncbi:MAG TPA: hypothetical protein IAB63_09650 [Candidatus Onthocola gallistercoris]|uniref:Uncharacterized protein n=1 Tax=Candidatus Onthocola gallistercoris TaxID=2840876 RepID=A0A9D1KWQ7_9FIRM|nr:hypothetical protein [Candidatus Onthocola gallistercoris]
MEFVRRYSRQITAGIQLVLCLMMAVVAFQKELKLGLKASKKINAGKNGKRKRR